jgi:NitT/TauT family transport system substrate-binding protein
VTWSRPNGSCRGAALAVVVATVCLFASSCANSQARSRGSADVLRLGLSPTLIQAPALVAVGTGQLASALAPTRLQITWFDSGKDAAIALLAGSIDAAYMGPGPTEALYLRSHDVAEISGVTTGGASLVVRADSNIRSPADLHGAKIAVPGISDTQDIALRTWLHRNGLASKQDGGDVQIAELGSSELLQLMRQHQLDAAWVPEPYPTYLVTRGVGRVLLDEGSLWPKGQFVTADLAASTAYMDAHPDVVQRLVAANVDAIRSTLSDPDHARWVAAKEIIAGGGPSTAPDVTGQAWGTLSFTWQVLPDAMDTVAEDSYTAGVLGERPGSLAGMYRLDDLNTALKDRDLPPVEVPR